MKMAARAIHQASLRKDMSFVTVECAGLTETLFESELFGHAKGAFPGASYHKQGLVDAANGGALFPDEIGDIPSAQQVKLLRLIETATYRQLVSIEALRVFSPYLRDPQKLERDGAAGPVQGRPLLPHQRVSRAPAFTERTS
jgi:transcriptional regulator with PAS, ATPase and Fis domain